MSSPQATAQPPAEQSQATQAALAVLVGLAIAKLWPSLDMLHLRQSLPAFKAAVAVEVQRHSQAAATAAARQYRVERVRAGVGGGFTPVPADPPSVEQIAQAVDWAVQPLWDSSVALETLGVAPEETQQVASTAIADAKARVAAASEKLVLDAGWSTITDSVLADRKAKAYARIPEPGACYFCVLLASRGAVYKDNSFAADKVKFKVHPDFPDADRAHDNCRCHLEPVFGRYEPSAQIRQWQQTYKDVAEEIGYGTDGRVTAKDQRRAFRQRLEGRPVDISKPGQSGSPKSSTKTPPRKPGERTQDEIRAELTALEKKFPELTDEQPRQWMQSRMDALRTQLDQQ